MVWVLRFLNNIGKRKPKISGQLSSSEIEKAELYCVKQTQQIAFNCEIMTLKHEKPIDKDSSLYNLNPKFDENGLLVVSGRLQFSEFSQKEKHPWILPGGNFTNLLIKNAHEKVYPPDQPMVFNPQNPNAPPIYPCGICHKEVHDNDQAVLCESGCNFWFHRVCTGLTEPAFHLLSAEVYAEWVCDKCLSSKNIPLVKFKP
ncbi:Protein pygopus, partial [Stegodyphus mimosarum]